MRFIWADFLPPTPAYTKINPSISNFYQGQLYPSTASRGKDGDFPGGPVAKTLSSQLREVWVRSLVRELEPTCSN